MRDQRHQLLNQLRFHLADQVDTVVVWHLFDDARESLMRDGFDEFDLKVERKVFEDLGLSLGSCMRQNLPCLSGINPFEDLRHDPGVEFATEHPNASVVMLCQHFAQVRQQQRVEIGGHSFGTCRNPWRPATSHWSRSARRCGPHPLGKGACYRHHRLSSHP